MSKMLEFILTPVGLVLMGIAVLVLLFVLAYASKISFLIVGYIVLGILMGLVVYMIFKITHPDLVDRILDRLSGGKPKE